MSHCCNHYHHHCWSPCDWNEGPYQSHPRRYAGPSREEYLRQIEEEREMLERRLRRLEQELGELRQQRRSLQE